MNKSFLSLEKTLFNIPNQIAGLLILILEKIVARFKKL
jgi:hypothetical protein